MRIEVRTEGGLAYFPGLSKPVIVDSAQLAPADAAELERRVEDAHFFTLQAKYSEPPRGAADYRRYTITIEDAGRRHSVQYTDLDAAPELDSLRRLATELAHKQGGG